MQIKGGKDMDENQSKNEQVSFLTRIIDVFIAPKRAMKVASEKSIILGFLVVIAISAMIIYIPQRPMFLKMTMTAIENSKEAISADEVDTLISGGANAAMFLSMFYFICTPLFKGLVVYAVSTILGGKGKLKSTVGIVLNAYMIMMIGQALRMIVVLATGNPYFSFSPAVFLPVGQQTTPLFSLLSAVDIFAVWYLAVSMYGVQIAQKLTPVKAFLAVFGPWLMMLSFGLAGVSGM